MAIVEKVFRSFKPDIVINTAAYTAVDAAELNEELAVGINAHGAENVAKAAQRVKSRLIHVSTDYVFDGRRSTPYPPNAPTNPVNVYGASKVEGEKLVLAVAPGATIIRVGWLYSMAGRNFLCSVLTALLGSRALSVVVDQQGCPTSAHEFAAAMWKIPDVRLRGIYHWANSGSGSWYDFAREIARIARQLELLREEPEIRPVTSEEYASRARRPAYSVLSATKLARALKVSPSMWQEALQCDMMRSLPHPSPRS
jgi:dTDP-4-dehydrorhamnose reductase